MNIPPLPSAGSRLNQLRLRGWLLLALIPLLATAGALVWRVPTPANYQWFVEEDEPQLCWSAERGDKFWCLHALTGEVAEQPRFALECVAPTMPDGNCFAISTEHVSAGRWQGKVTIADPQTGQILREIPLNLSGSPQMVGRRYLVSMDATQISAIDLCDAKPSPFRLSAPLSGTWTSIAAVPGKNWFWRINDGTKPGQVEVFEISEQSIQRRFNWPVGTLGHRAGQFNDMLLSITPDNQHIEQRSLETGEVLQTLDLPPDFDPQTMESAFRDGLFVTKEIAKTEQTYYDPIKNEQLRLPDDRFYLQASSPNGRLRLFVNYADSDFLTSTRIVVYDMVAASVLFDFRMPRAYYFGQFLPDNRLMLAGDQYGLSTYVIDLGSGRVMHRQSPFRWVAWAMPLLLLSFLGWAILWLRASSSGHIGIWCDIALLSALVMLPLILRLFAVEPRTDLSRLPYNYCHGIFLGLFQLSVAWLVFGSARLTVRYIPALVVLAALVMALTLVLGTDDSAAEIAIGALATTAMLVLPMGLVAGLVRLGGWRLIQVDQSGHVRLAPRERISMRDPFIALTCFALVAAALRPLAPYLFRYNPDAFPLAILAIHVAATFVALMFALTSRQIVSRLGIIALVLLSVAIVAQPTYGFVVGQLAGFPFSAPMVYFRVIGTAALATYIFALAFRFRGWRLMRKSAGFSLRSPRPPR